MPQGAPQRLDLLFVRALLPLGQLQGLQHFVHVIQRVSQRVADLVNFFNRLLNRRRRRRSPLWAGPVGKVLFDGTGF